MQQLTLRQLGALVSVTLIWGLNWPVMKVGVSGYPALTFRAASMLLGLPILAVAMLALKVPFRVRRKDWPQLLVLSSLNMLVWHFCIILAIQSLSSGRAAILGYTMPIFSAILGALLFATALTLRGWMGVSAAAIGVALLLWHELTGLAGSPGGVALALFASAVWALGTQLFRRTTIEAATLTLSFWMMTFTTAVLFVVAALFERSEWRMPSQAVTLATLYNGILVFGYAQAGWLFLARTLPPVASSLSVMLIPVIGVFTGAVWLREVLHWQDYAAVVLMVVAIASVLWPAKQPPPARNEAG